MPTSTSKYQYVTCDPSKCVGCQICEYICSYTKTGEFNTYRSRIRTVRAEEVLVTAVTCRTCEDAPCVIACPRDALTQDPITVHPDTSIEEIASLMVDKRFHTIPVVDKGELVGIIGKVDILKTLMPGTESK